MRLCLCGPSGARFSKLVSLLVTPLARMNIVEFQRFLDKLGSVAETAIAPGRDIGIMFIVALRFALCRLIFLAEMAAAGLVPFPSVDAHQLSQLEEVGDAAGLFKTLVQIVAAARNRDVPPEFFAQFANFSDGGFETFRRAGHAAVFPDDFSQLAME